MCSEGSALDRVVREGLSGDIIGDDAGCQKVLHGDATWRPGEQGLGRVHCCGKGPE